MCFLQIMKRARSQETFNFEIKLHAGKSANVHILFL